MAANYGVSSGSMDDIWEDITILIEVVGGFSWA